jgi:hypothetical protein
MSDEIKQTETLEAAPLAEELKAAASPEVTPEAEEGEAPEAEAVENKALEELPLPDEEKDYEKNWPKGFKERLKRQNKQLEQREHEARRLQEELTQIKSALHAPAPQLDTQNVPMRENFSSEDAYIEAIVDHKAKKREEALLNKMYEKKLNEATAERRKKQEQIDEEGIKRYPDYEETVNILFKQDFPGNEGMYKAITKSKYAADILYHLGRYPDQARQTAELDDVDAIKKIMKLEERLEARKKGNVTKMPAPLTKLTGTSANLSTKDPSQMSPAEYRQYREESKARPVQKR